MVSPGPTLQELIDAVVADAPGEPLGQLAQAARTVSALDEVSDALLGHFVDRCRRSGRSWSEISGALGVTRQAAHKRFSAMGPAFERFTPRALAVLRGAADEARALGRRAVGTEHLLLALFSPAESVAAHVLADAGITRDASEAEVRALPAASAEEDAAGRPGVGEPAFTRQAVDALRLAVEEALLFGHNYVGTEHMLLALFRLPADRAAQVLAALGADAGDVRARIGVRLDALLSQKTGAAGGSPGVDEDPSGPARGDR